MPHIMYSMLTINENLYVWKEKELQIIQVFSFWYLQRSANSGPKGPWSAVTIYDEMVLLLIYFRRLYLKK